MMEEVPFQFLSSAEKKVYEWLTKKKIPFRTQVKMFGGQTEVGGAVIDFILPDLMIAIRVMGTYWHSTLEASARDMLGKERLAGEGYIVVDVWEDQLEDEQKIDYVMEQAIMGIEVPR